MEFKFKLNLKKKGFDYFGTLVKMSGYALEEARFLKEIFTDFDHEALKDNQIKMHELEHGCDQEKHSLTQALVKEFLPPVDRDDLFRLAHLTDNITDAIEGITGYLYMAAVKTLRPDTMEFVDLMIECCECVEKLLKEFSNFKKSADLKGYIINLNDKEELGDRLYSKAMRELSEHSSDTREILEWRAIYKRFEDFFDSAETLADNIESVVMKNT